MDLSLHVGGAPWNLEEVNMSMLGELSKIFLFFGINNGDRGTLRPYNLLTRSPEEAGEARPQTVEGVRRMDRA